MRSAVKIADFPDDSRPQIIFAGKSNVGKSSTINKLLLRKNIARVAASPGKTTHINFFDIDQTLYFVDLPGYGYAKVSKAEQKRWGALIDDYFFNVDKSLALGIHIVDMRHKPTADDVIMSEWYLQSGVPLLVVANKYDKVKPSMREECLNTIKTTLRLPIDINLIPFSAQTGFGRDKIWEVIEHHI